MPVATRPPPAPRSHSGPANMNMATFYKDSTKEMGNESCGIIYMLLKIRNKINRIRVFSWIYKSFHFEFSKTVVIPGVAQVGFLQGQQHQRFKNR